MPILRLVNKLLWVLPAIGIAFALASWSAGSTSITWLQAAIAIVLASWPAASRRLGIDMAMAIEIGIGLLWLCLATGLVESAMSGKIDSTTWDGAPTSLFIVGGLLAATSLLPLAAAAAGRLAVIRWTLVSGATVAMVAVRVALDVGEQAFSVALLPWFTYFAAVTVLALLAASALDAARGQIEDLNHAARDARRQVEVAGRQRSEFVTNMSHELRTPLAGILGLTEILLKEPATKDRQLQVRLIQDSTRGLLAIIDDLLDVGRIESGAVRLETSCVDLRRLVERTVGFLAPQAATKNLAFECHVDPALPAILLVDEVRVRQILLNLLYNALKFTETGKVETRLLWLADEDKARFEVEDSGIGIAESVIPRLFMPFQQADSSTSRQFGGTGLGLAISKSLVELMGGEIGTESQRGIGSTFWFELPLQEGQPPEVLRPTSQDDGQLRERRILVVEDDAINQLVIVAKLESFGMLVSHVENGVQALEILAAEEFDIVLMDCQIPGIDGYETTRRLRRSEGRLAELPVIALTAHVHPDERGRCLAAGMNDYLSKPVDDEQLLRILTQWLEPSSVRAQLVTVR